MTQMALAHCDKVVEQLTADAADPALGDTIVPGAAVRVYASTPEASIIFG
jgi:hypothetical protein